MSMWTIWNWLYIEGLTPFETLLLYFVIGAMIYLAYLQIRHVRRRRRHRRHRARKRARAAAEAALGTEEHLH